MKLPLANRMRQMKSSEIREIVRFIGKPGIISFAGGMPAPELFPIEEIKKATIEILDTNGADSLQYSPSEGFLPLRERISELMTESGIKNITSDNILIINGSQQGLDFSGKIFLNPNDIVVCESPTYLGAINSFKAYQCKFVECPSDDYGMEIEALDAILELNSPNVKLIYVTPDFQNPTGKTWSTTRRMELIDIVNKHNVFLIEDNPYGELRYDGEYHPPIKSFDTNGKVVYLGTFSKTICPGLRIAWVCANKDVLRQYHLIKEAADIQCNSLAERQIDHFLQKYDYKSHIKRLREVYKRRRDLMLKILDSEFPTEVKYKKSKGGFFIWIELPKNLKAKELQKKAIEHNLAFITGDSFFPNGGHENYIRLCFSNSSESAINEGMHILEKILKKSI